MKFTLMYMLGFVKWLSAPKVAIPKNAWFVRRGPFGGHDYWVWYFTNLVNYWNPRNPYSFWNMKNKFGRKGE